jgi:gliding motility-associated-like protein
VRKLLFGLLFFISALGFATHNRAGEILYTRIAPFYTIVAGVTVPAYTYSIVIVTYTDDGPGIADRCEDTVYFGDGQRAIAHRLNFPNSSGALSNCGCGSEDGCGNIIISETDYRVKKNVYSTIHTYAGAGNYTIRFFDPNRNANVVNIPNSVNQPFYVESLLIINAFTGANSSPQFLYDPIDRACLGKCFTHNPGAYDPDGDSLSYEITQCRVAVDQVAPGYFYPNYNTNSTFGINAVTGLLSWCSPSIVGEYNIAFIVKEWRKNTDGLYVQIGYMIRDMQVVVEACPNNNPPIVIVPADTCVEAGTFITKKIIVKDFDTYSPNTVVLTGAAGAFAALSPDAGLTNTSGVMSAANGNSFVANFTWQTTCDHVRDQPYESVFKALDNGSPVRLATYASYNIRVVPPSVKNVTAVPIGTTIKISWALSTCNPASNPLSAYKIYRKNDCSPFIQVPCQTGMVPSSGFTYVGQTNATTAFFIDNNNGNGLVVGQNYSYIVVAVYTDGTQTFGSSQVCAKLKRDIPLILNVDVRATATDVGSIYIHWENPLTTAGNFDTIALPGPYTLTLKYREAGTTTYTPVFTSATAQFLKLATEYLHTGINTVDNGKEYSIDFIAGATNVGSSQVASSVFLTTTPGDRKVRLQWVSQTPWNNTSYIISRKDPGATTFINTATVTGTQYTDSATSLNLIANRHTYCYKVLANGAYSDPSVFSPLLNFSEESCATAKDITPPCTPTLTVQADCPAGTLTVTWNDVRTLSCGDDVIKYILYYKPTINDTYQPIVNGLLTSYIYDGVSDSLISGCYAIQAMDSSNNLSPLSPDFCIDNCPIFELPNVFTPNADGTNDFFKAIRVRQIKEINMTVIDRWGTPVYNTTDPYFKWDGVSIASNKPVSEGTFFYICDVFEPRLTGTIKRTLKGFVQVIR